MRLTCPNCAAQYEIDASLIPDTGRDVQCSNCGKTWFQEPVGGLSTASEETLEAPPAPEPAPEPLPEDTAPPEEDGDGFEPDADQLSGLTDEAAAFFGQGQQATSGSSFDDEAELIDEASLEPAPDTDDVQPSAPEPEPEASEPEPKAPEPPHAAPDVPRREIDPQVRSILEEERDRELAARQSDRAETLETQGELGLTESSPVESATAERTARLRGALTEEPLPSPGPVAAPLPDVEEINSTLTASADRRERIVTHADLEEAQSRRSGFRFGFSLMMVLAALLIVIYLSAPALARAVPALETPLAAYVDWANAMRQGIDGVLERSVGRLSAMLQGLSN